MSLDAEICYAALTERNADFDGVFFVGVRTPAYSAARPVLRARPSARTASSSPMPGRRCCVLSPLQAGPATGRIRTRQPRSCASSSTRSGATPDKLWRTADFDALHVHAVDRAAAVS